MKTDLVLTMDEGRDECCIVPKRPIPPTHGEEHGCRCDRWGHPCPGCLERKPQTRAVSADFPSAKQMR